MTVDSSREEQLLTGPRHCLERRRHSLPARGCPLCCSVGGATCVCTDGAARHCSIDSFYETRRLVGALHAVRSWRRVALLLPDHLLPDAPALLKQLQEVWRQTEKTWSASASSVSASEAPPCTSSSETPFFYFCGDRPAGQCCVDVVGASWLEPDILIHVGSFCCSRPFAASPKPVLFVGTRSHLDVWSCASALRSLLLRRGRGGSGGSRRCGQSPSLSGEDGLSPTPRSLDDVETDAGSEQPGRGGSCCVVASPRGEEEEEEEENEGLDSNNNNNDDGDESGHDEEEEEDEEEDEDQDQDQEDAASSEWLAVTGKRGKEERGASRRRRKRKFHQQRSLSSATRRSRSHHGVLLVVQSEYSFSVPCLLQHLATTRAFTSSVRSCVSGSGEEEEGDESLAPSIQNQKQNQNQTLSSLHPASAAEGNKASRGASVSDDRSMSSVDDLPASCNIWKATHFFLALPPAALLPCISRKEAAKEKDASALELAAVLAAQRQKEAYGRDLEKNLDKNPEKDVSETMVDFSVVSSSCVNRVRGSSACLLLERDCLFDCEKETNATSWGEFFEMPALLNEQICFLPPLSNSSSCVEMLQQTPGVLTVGRAKKFVRVAGRPVFSVLIRETDEALALRPVVALGEDDSFFCERDSLGATDLSSVTPTSSLPTQLRVSSLALVLLGQAQLSSLESGAAPLHAPLTDVSSLLSSPPSPSAFKEEFATPVAKSETSSGQDEKCLCAKRASILASQTSASEMDYKPPSPLLLRLLLRHGGVCRILSLDPSVQVCPGSAKCVAGEETLCQTPGIRLCEKCDPEKGTGGPCCKAAVLIDEAPRAASQLARHFAALRGVESSRQLSLLLFGQQTSASLQTHAALVHLASEEEAAASSIRRDKRSVDDEEEASETSAFGALPCLSVAGSVSVAVGEATAAKLLNFRDTDAYCLIGCTESCLLLRLRQKALGLESRSLVLPVDLLVAAGAIEWSSECLVECEELSSLFKLTAEPHSTDASSPLSSDLPTASPPSADASAMLTKKRTDVLADKTQGALARVPVSLRLQSERTFQGVSFSRPAEIEEETGEPRIWKGRHGVASAYSKEKEKCRSEEDQT